MGALVPADDIPDAAGPVVDDKDISRPTNRTAGTKAAYKPMSTREQAAIVLRPLAKGVIGAISFVPDLAVSAANLLPENSFWGKRDETPSSYFNRQLDKALPPPPTAAGRAAEEAASMLVGGVAGGVKQVEKAGAQIADKALTRVTTKAAEDAHVSGYKLPPSYIGGPVRKTVQSMVGGPKVEKEFSKVNEAVTDRLAKVALGLSPEHELTADTFKALKAEAYKPYEAVRKVGVVPTEASGEYLRDVQAAGGRFANKADVYEKSEFPEVDELIKTYSKEGADSGNMLDRIRVLRDKARYNLSKYDPVNNATGYTQRAIANAMENRIERYAAEKGDKTLVTQLRAARQQLAKISSVEDSIGAGGHVRASDLAKLQDKGVPLTDSLKVIATTAKNFPKAVQDTAKQGESGAWSAVDYLLGGTGIAYGHPSAVLTAVARPVVRATLRSKGAQKAMISGLRSQPGPVRQAAGRVAGEIGGAARGLAKPMARGAAAIGAEDANNEMADRKRRRGQAVPEDDLP
jgi:hypothetical protein